jgi:hypothetical protein
MRVAVLGEPAGWHVQRLAAALADRGHAATVVPWSAIGAGVAAGADRFMPHELATCDVVAVRGMPGAGTADNRLEEIVFRMDALGRLAARGTRIVNSPRALEVAIDKYLSLSLLAAAGLPVPETRVVQGGKAENIESWLAWREAAERPVPGYVEEELRGYLECGLLCFGFARALCTGCGQGFFVAFSCKGRGVCPSCNGRHMPQTAAHLVDHVIPPVPVRQWVISVPKRLRGMLADRPAAVAALTRIFLDEIERLLCAAAGVTGAANTLTAARPRLGAVSFLHRFGSALNHHVHLHACVTDGVFMPAADGAGKE